MSVTWILIGGVILALIGFIVLQRRKPDTADKIASSLDQVAKDAAQKAEDLLKKK